MKDIKGYEGLYAITSCGKVWSYKNKIFLKPQKKAGDYLQVGLWKKGKRKDFLVHRLVAEAYIPNPDNLPEVLHNDEIAWHNWLNNLSWGTHKENCGAPKRRARLGKKVLCLETGIIYESAAEASKQTGISRCGIGACCRGQQKTAGGFHWEFVVD